MSQPQQEGSHPTSQPSPSLPPELSVRIVGESEEMTCCMVSHLSQGLLKCEGLQDFTTVVYTRGEVLREGGYTRGSIEVIPLQHRCIFETIRTGTQAAIPYDQNDELSVELEARHLTQRVNVVDLEIKRDVFIDLIGLELASRGVHSRRIHLLAEDESQYVLLNRKVLETVPLDITNEQRAFAERCGSELPELAADRKLRPGDQHPACQKIRQLMLRCLPFSYQKRRSLRIALGLHILRRQDAWGFINYLRMNEERAMSASINLDWAKLTNLDTLYVDLRYSEPEASFRSFRAWAAKMGAQVKLKTLVLLGVPCLANLEAENPDGQSGKEYWISHLEDFAYFQVENARPGRHISWINVFKDCMRPGGQIHFIDDFRPGLAYWPGRVNDIEVLDE